MGDAGITVAGLYVYPVKGCGGIELETAAVTPLGLATPNKLLRDRFWMVVREDGKFITQRQKPELALVRVRVEPHEAISQPVANPPTLVLSAPGMPNLNIPIVDHGSAGMETDVIHHRKNACRVEVWGWHGFAYCEHDAASDWFSELLGMPVRMVRYGGDVQDAEERSNSEFHRQTDRTWAPDGVEIAFADGYPILLTSLESLNELNRHLPSPIPMNRFRPNITIKGGPGMHLRAWDEDCWERLSIGSTVGSTVGSTGPTESSNEAIQFLNVKPCDRCKVPTIDQETGIAGDEPTLTLRRLRSGNVLGWTNPPSFKLSVFFGVNLCCMNASEHSILKVGDVVRIDAHRNGLYLQRQTSHA